MTRGMISSGQALSTGAAFFGDRPGEGDAHALDGCLGGLLPHGEL
jgi:hypothetical protein